MKLNKLQGVLKGNLSSKVKLIFKDDMNSTHSLWSSMLCTRSPLYLHIEIQRNSHNETRYLLNLFDAICMSYFIFSNWIVVIL